ncbi:hypothetical protein P3X46_027461 [Hevea brasiliensis]|uniref:chitinase n=1 Tax=Hevea brasiliensis TaxID=3981 RepID=A0ABQ9L2Y6_HEVBR|nr:hypothetical protein P3X46_027461 [Hevea brasiliensis]
MVRFLAKSKARFGRPKKGLKPSTNNNKGKDHAKPGKNSNQERNNPPNQNDVSVDGIVTEDFFNRIMDKAEDSCERKKFYSREKFLNALKSYPRFGTDGSVDESKREIAAFFAHVTHETSRKISYPTFFCDKSYHGRGPIQLSMNYNYGPAGESNDFDGLNSPETVAKDPLVSFKAALWFWMTNVHDVMISHGFGETIRAMNYRSNECNGGDETRGYYTDYCKQFGVEPGDKTRFLGHYKSELQTLAPFIV